jgi:hypothetical protein
VKATIASKAKGEKVERETGQGDLIMTQSLAPQQLHVFSRFVLATVFWWDETERVWAYSNTFPQ